MVQVTPPAVEPMEAVLRKAYRLKVNLILLYDPAQEPEYQFGARLTPWGRNPEGVMYYGSGSTVQLAMVSAFGAVDAHEPQDLDYEFRGWYNADAEETV